MSTIYNKIKDGNICIEHLENEIDNSDISSELETIIVNDNYYIQLTFNSELSPSDENDLDDLILNHDCDDVEQGVDFDEFATVQLSNVNTIEPTSSEYNSILIPNILIENKPSVISKNGSNIDIHESALYNVSYNGVLDAEISIVYAQIFIVRDNESIGIPGSEKIYTISDALPWTRYSYNKQNTIVNIDIDLNLTLLKNDRVGIKLKKIRNPNAGRYGGYHPPNDDATNAIILPNSVFSITKLTGAKGEPGVAGIPGASGITIKKQNAIKVNNAEKINFIGNVTVTDDGNGQANVNILSNNNNFAIHQIMAADDVISEPMAFLVDSTRNDKMLSIETTPYQFGEHVLTSNDWMIINDANNTEAGFSVPYDGVIVRASGKRSSDKGAGTIELYINDDDYDILRWENKSGRLEDHCTNINIPINRNDSIRLRSTHIQSNLRDVVITIWVKWEVRNS